MFVLKEGLELSTDHHLVVCTLKALKPLKKRETYRINGNHWLTKRYELHLQTTLHLSSKNFRPLLKTLELSGVCFVSVLEGQRVAKKELLGGSKKLKKLFVRKK